MSAAGLLDWIGVLDVASVLLMVAALKQFGGRPGAAGFNVLLASAATLVSTLMAVFGALLT